MLLRDEMGEGRGFAWEIYGQRKMGGRTKFKTILKMGGVALKLPLMPFKMENGKTLLILYQEQVQTVPAKRSKKQVQVGSSGCFLGAFF